MRGGLRRILLYSLIALSFSSCTRVIYIEDPYFKSFALSSERLYSLNQRLSLFKAGIRADFVEFADTAAFAADLTERIASGSYDALVLSPLALDAAGVNTGIFTVLVGGPPELAGENTAQIFFSDSAALYDAGLYLFRRYKEEGIEPVVVFYSSDGISEGGREALLSSWPEDVRYVLYENWLDLDSTFSPDDGRIENFLSSYDLSAGNHIVLGYCAPVIRSLMVSLDPATPLILAAPESPYLPPGCIGLIRPDYQQYLNTAAAVLKEGNTEPAAVDNLFILR